MDGVFSIRLNKEGIGTARLVARVFTFLTILTFFLAALALFREIYVYKVYRGLADGMELKHGFWAGIVFRIVPIVFFIVTVINIIASVFMLRFVTRLRYSLRTMDEDSFSKSFRSLAIAGMIWLVATIANIAVYSVLLINQFKNDL